MFHRTEVMNLTGSRSLSAKRTCTELAEVSKGVCEWFLMQEYFFMAYMYIQECADSSYYTGSTWNVDKRLWEHQQGIGANYTKYRLPVILVYFEEYDREDPFYREKQVQGWSRKKKKAFIDGRMEDLPKLAKKIFFKK